MYINLHANYLLTGLTSGTFKQMVLHKHYFYFGLI